MRKGRFFKYLLAALIVLGTSFNVRAQVKNLKLYFNQFTTGNTGVPELIMKGDVPNANEHVTVSQNGFDWASKYRVFILNRQNCQDRIVANKVTVDGKEKSHASISFTNFKYEVKQIQWNVMNDLFSDNLIGWTKTLQITGNSNPVDGSSKTGTTGSWAVFGKEMSFGKENLPGTNNNLQFKGLESLSIEEVNKWILIRRDTKLDDDCRIFIKAGQQGSAEPNANDWAFQVSYYEPSLSLSGIPSMMFLGQERNFTSGDYSVLHTGAFNFTLESVVSSEPEVISIDANGKMVANNVGSSTITVTMKDGDGDKVITASKTIDVKTLTPQEGVHYYHNNSNRNSIEFSKLNHTDGDYSFSTSDKTDGDFKCLGVLKSATNNDYKVGAKVIDFPMSAPAYTTVTAPFDFKLTSSQTGLNAFDDFGGEIIITEDYNNLTLITNNSASTGSVYKRWKDFFIGTSQSVANNTTLINNSDKASAVKDKTFHMILMSAGDATITSKTLTTEFYYKIIPSIITYYSYITFDGNGGTITTTSKTQTIANTNGNDGKVGTTNLNNINVASRVGYTFIGWNTEADGTGEFYAPRGAFRPSTVETGGEGKGYITLYAVWQPNTYTVTLNQAGGSKGSTSVTATFGEPLPSGENVNAPEKYGYTFGGYFTEQNGAGTMYYDNSMTGVKDWDKATNTTLYAKWTANVCKVELRPNGTGAVAGTPYVMVTHNQKFPEEVDGHAVVPPTRPGYIFNGFYQMYQNNKTYFYDKDMKTASCANWPYQADYEVLADWIPKTTKITFNRGGAPDKMDWGGDNGTSSVTATYDQSMPQITAPQRSGYTFAGYYDQPNGQGKKYYDFRWGNVESVTSWDKDVVEATLYAYWAEKDYTVEFVYPKGGNKQVTGYKTNSSNNTSLAGKGITSPTPPEGSVFAGWAENDGKGSVVYDADGNAVEGNCWQRNSNGDIVWIGGIDEIVRVYPYYIKDMVTVNVTVVRDDNYENTDYNHRYVGVSVSGMADITSFTGDFSGYITVDGENFLSYLKPGQENYPPVSGKSYPDNLTSVPLSSAPIWHFELREGATDMYNIYTVVNGQKLYLGPKVESTVTEDAISVNPFVPDFPFIIYGGGYVCYNPLDTKVFNHVLYMKDDTNWEYENTGRNPQYKPIKIIAASSTTTTYGNLNAKTVIKAIKEKLTSPEYAYNVGKANVDIKDADLCKGLLYVDMGGAAKVMETTAGELRNFKDEVSDNCLFFMPKTYNNTLGTNVVTNMGDKYVSADDLVITDKVPFSSPYTFSTGSHIASYNRVTSDKWGSMCLPFPVKRSGSDMKFYNLYGSDDIRLAFKSDDGTNDIPANEPIACYGSGSFTLTSNSNAVVPADNASREYDKAVTAISCDNIRELVEDKKQMTKDSKTWNFKGVRFDSYVYGTEYTGTLPNCPNCAKKSLVYYFSKDKFTYVNSKGRVKFAPFRAYLQAPEGSSAKTFSLLVFDEDGATDITEIIDGNAGVANGKIYDLFGRRVKTPLKGHIYIVDGKKKQY